MLFGFLPTTTTTDINSWPEIGWDAGCIHYFTKKTFVKYIEQCGFEVEKVEPTGFLANVLRVLPQLFAAGWVVQARKKETKNG